MRIINEGTGRAKECGVPRLITQTLQAALLAVMLVTACQPCALPDSTTSVVDSGPPDLVGNWDTFCPLHCPPDSLAELQGCSVISNKLAFQGTFILCEQQDGTSTRVETKENWFSFCVSSCVPAYPESPWNQCEVLPKSNGTARVSCAVTPACD